MRTDKTCHSVSCGVGKTTVIDTLCRASAAKLHWPLPADLDDEQLECLLYRLVREQVDVRYGVRAENY